MKAMTPEEEVTLQQSSTIPYLAVVQQDEYRWWSPIQFR